MWDTYLEREKEQLQLNATLNSKCGSLSDEQTKQPADAKVTPNKRSKSIKPSNQMEQKTNRLRAATLRNPSS